MPQRENQGFLTSLNRYVDRKEGWKIAKENNQIQWGLSASENGEDSQLISENLYQKRKRSISANGSGIYAVVRWVQRWKIAYIPCYLLVRFINEKLKLKY